MRIHTEVFKVMAPTFVSLRDEIAKEMFSPRALETAESLKEFAEL